jgi:hypothetical protein
MKKLILAITIILITISSAKAQYELGDAANNPILIQAIVPLFSCEDAVIRENLFLPRYDEKRIRRLITDGCASQIEAVLEACEWATDYEDDECETIVGNMISHQSKTIVKNIMKEEKLK